MCTDIRLGILDWYRINNSTPPTIRHHLVQDMIFLISIRRILIKHYLTEAISMVECYV